jgi:hypothetical protein
MTARRGLKKKVRDRMGRTGESYSTALRQVSAGRTSTISHRESALVGYLLERAGLDLPEAMVCGLGGGIGFMYAVFEYDAVPHPLLTLVMQHHPQPWAPAVFDRLGLPYAEAHSSSPRAARAALEAAAGPLLCTVDRQLLPWQPPAPDHASGAEPHTVVVADGVVLDPPFGPRPLDLDAFLAAWAAHRKGRFHRVTLTGVSDVDLDAAARDAIDVTVAHLTGPVLGNAFDVNFGFSGMARLAGDLRDARTRKGFARRFASPDGRAHALRRLRECLEVQYTAPGGTRPIYADFLALTGHDEAAGLIRRSGERWTALARATADVGDRRAWCDRAASTVEDALALETQAAALLSGAAVGR